jgi:protein-L-isoaspartate(D-aspartate) O-methyltransferase
MDYATQKMQFVFQLRSGGVTDARVLNAMEDIPRDAFMEGLFKDRAQEDVALPIPCGQTISAPSVVGLMTQALDLEPRSKVLEIGTGSGYQAAVLAHLARRVYTLERHRELAKRAEQVFAELGITNVVTLHKDGTAGLAEQSPFDRILVTAAADDVPSPLIAQLAEGGILVMPVGAPDQTQTLIKVIKTPGGLEYKEYQDVRFVPLVEGLGALDDA